jgi:hypothetical protein
MTATALHYMGLMTDGIEREGEGFIYVVKYADIVVHKVHIPTRLESSTGAMLDYGRKVIAFRIQRVLGA